MILKADDPHQMYFTSRWDLVSGEALLQTIDEVVNRLDLSGLYELWSEQGRGFYDPGMLLKILFFAYCDGERHSRGIAKKIRYDVRYQYFAGHLRPKYRTICRFRTLGADLLSSYFAQIVSVCDEMELLDVSCLALDGTKVRASASRRQTYGKSDLSELAARYRELLAKDAEKERLDNSDEEDDEENGDTSGKTVDREDLKKRIEKVLKSLESGAKEVNLTDSDARLMKDSERRFHPSYNGQIAVDRNQFIVAVDVGNNSNDAGYFRKMYSESQAHVSDQVSQVLADGGYYSKGNVKYCIQEGIDIYMRMGKFFSKREGRYGREDFRYDKQKDVYNCPGGGTLRYKFSRRKEGVETRVYRGSESECQSCKQKARCTDGKARDLNISEVWEYEREVNEKLASENGRAVYGLRKVLVEPVFGNMKYNMGFRRFVLRGLKNVKLEFFLMCIAHNLKKLARHIHSWQPQKSLEPCHGG
jgi:transposase